MAAEKESRQRRCRTGTDCAAAQSKGDAPDPKACSLLGKCRITDLPPDLPKGTLVEVTYSFDKSGRISVSAREKAGGHEAKIDIERKGTLTENQVEDLTHLAEEYSIE